MMACRPSERTSTAASAAHRTIVSSSTSASGERTCRNQAHCRSRVGVYGSGEDWSTTISVRAVPTASAIRSVSRRGKVSYACFGQ